MEKWGRGEKKGKKKKNGCGGGGMKRSAGGRKRRKEGRWCGGRSAGEEKGERKEGGAGEHRKWRARTLARKKTEFFKIFMAIKISLPVLLGMIVVRF